MHLPRILMLLILACPVPGLAQTLQTFTLPVTNPANGAYYPDIQASFPSVQWATLDRLYLPAGQYKFLRIGNLPVRSASRPLVITNLGGQVRIGGLGHYYVFPIGGGSNWRLTGHYDAAAATGDAAYQGHAGGAYATSRGRYGILVDDGRIENEDGTDTGYSGVSVGGGATDFEIDFIEVTRVGFAGIVLKTDNNGDAHMRNVRIHDTYVHDTGSEGFYIGSTQAQPQHRIEGLKFYNNRVVRTGTEMFQLGQAGGGSDIHHNVFMLGALDWKSPFQSFQDNAIQLSPRAGSLRFRNNIVIGGAGSLLNMLGANITGDPHAAGDLVELSDNVWSHSRHFGLYVARLTDGVTNYRFERNSVSNIVFTYTELTPGTTNYNQVFRMGSGTGVANTNPIALRDNRWQGPQVFVFNWTNPNQTVGNVTSTGNTNVTTMPSPRFVDSGFPEGFDWFRIEQWGRQTPAGAAITYQPGDYATYQGKLYRSIATAAHSGQRPDQNPTTWQLQPDPADDLRLAADSPVQGVGLLDGLGAIFAHGFE